MEAGAAGLLLHWTKPTPHALCEQRNPQGRTRQRRSSLHTRDASRAHRRGRGGGCASPVLKTILPSSPDPRSSAWTRRTPRRRSGCRTPTRCTTWLLASQPTPAALRGLKGLGAHRPTQLYFPTFSAAAASRPSKGPAPARSGPRARAEHRHLACPPRGGGSPGRAPWPWPGAAPSGAGSARVRGPRQARGGRRVGRAEEQAEAKAKAAEPTVGGRRRPAYARTSGVHSPAPGLSRRPGRQLLKTPPPHPGGRGRRRDLPVSR